MRRSAAILLLACGVALIVVPFAMSMPSRSRDGARMVEDFRPIMQARSVDTTARYYQLFQGFGRDFGTFMTEEKVKAFQGYLASMGKMQKQLPSMLEAFGRQLDMTPAQTQRFLRAQFPDVAAGLSAFPQMGRDFNSVVSVMARDVGPFADVPPALAHYGDLVQRMERNVDTYAAVDALPRMSAFTWFFVVPGILVVLLSGALLASGRKVKLPTPAAPRTA